MYNYEIEYLEERVHVHYLQHVPFEGIGCMEQHFRARGHELTSTHLYIGQGLPQIGTIDWLIVMGGPMGVNDEGSSWLKREKHYIREAIYSGKMVLGVCLGAQLIADVLGAEVRSNGCREIGWFPVEIDHEAAPLLRGVLPKRLEAFHWHGDTFDIPEHAVPFASSEACRNQGFLLGTKIMGLQFHLESTQSSVRSLIRHCGEELDGSAYVQTEEAMLASRERFGVANEMMITVLRKMEEWNS
jgi:GMP synthase-like glutamine amidotransferase